MEEIKLLLEKFGQDGYVSPEDLKTVAEVVVLLVTKVEEQKLPRCASLHSSEPAL